jgi:hypothetical protein
VCRHRNETVAFATVELTELLIRGSDLAVVVFVVSSTLGVGLSLTVGQILAPRPFIIRFAEFAKADLAFAVGLMVLLMVITMGYLPLALPFLLEGITVNPAKIAQSLVVLMLIPLAVSPAPGLPPGRRRPHPTRGWVAVQRQHDPRSGVDHGRPLQECPVGETGCAGPHLVDPARVFMPERKRQLCRHLSGGHLQQVQIRMAGTGTANLDQHLARPGLGHRHLTQLARLLPFDKLKRLHGGVLSVTN